MLPVLVAVGVFGSSASIGAHVTLEDGLARHAAPLKHGGSICVAGLITRVFAIARRGARRWAMRESQIAIWGETWTVAFAPLMERATNETP